MAFAGSTDISSPVSSTSLPSTKTLTPSRGEDKVKFSASLLLPAQSKLLSSFTPARAHFPPHRVLIYSSDCKAPFFLLNSNLNDNQVHTGFISAVPLQKRIFSSHLSTVKKRLECASPSLRTPKLRDACWRESSQEPTSQFGVETPSLHCPVSSKKDTAYPKEWKWGMS